MAESGSEIPSVQSKPVDQKAEAGLGNRVSRRGALGKIAAATVAAGAFLFGSRTAEAAPQSNRSSVSPEAKNPVVQASSAEISKQETEKWAMTEAKLRERAAIVNQLLKDPQKPSSVSISRSKGPEVTVSFYSGAANPNKNPDSKTILNPVLTLQYPDLRLVSEDQVMAEAGRNFAQMFLDSHPEKTIAIDFAQNFYDVTGLDLHAITKGNATPEQMAQWQSISKTLGFEYQEKKGHDKLPEALFKKIFSDWLNKGNDLDENFSKISGNQDEVSGIYLGVLSQIVSIARPGFSVSSLVKSTDLEKIVTYSKNSEYKKLFDAGPLKKAA